MGVYREVGRSPGVVRMLLAQLVARLPFGMISIIMLLHIQLVYGNYTQAGAILAAQSVGQAISGPLTSRLMGRLGMRLVLSVTTLVCSGLLTAIAVTRLPLVIVALLAFLIGITTPPIAPAVRTIYPKLVPGNKVTALFSLDASAQEVIWVIGPVLAVFVSTQLTTVAGLLVAAAFMLGGGVWFVASPEVGRVRIPRSRRRFGAVLTRPAVVVASVMSFFFVASFAAIEAGIVAEFGHEGIQSGIVLAIFSIGSVIGGLVLGHRAVRPWSMIIRASIALAGTLLCLVSMDPVWLSFALFLGGFGIAPMFAALFTIVSATVKFSETAESYGWVNTGMLVGVAMGSALAGVAIDAFGGIGGVYVCILFLVITIVCAVVSMPWIPDLKGKDATPIPDTDPVQLNP